MAVRNVLLVLADQQRRDAFGCYGNRWTPTPNYDRLAAEGTRFDRAYVANPICMPNRCSIATGRMPSHHGLWTNGLLLDERRTVMHHLAERGWQTASFGKIHLTPTGADHDRGESKAAWARRGDDFDWHGPYWGFAHVELAIGHGGRAPVAHYGRWFRERGGRPEMLVADPATGCRPIPVALHDSTFVAERTAAFLRAERDADRPFFCVASFPDPHHPFDPPWEVAEPFHRADDLGAPIGDPADVDDRPPRYRQQRDGAWSRGGVGEAKHPGGPDAATARRYRANTFAMNALIDRGLGTILAALDETGLADETLVIATADHGELLGDHGLWYKGPFFYEGLVNVPLIVRDPDRSGNATSPSLVSSVDLAPTVCDVLGVDPLPAADGRGFAPCLDDPAVRIRDHALVEYRNGYGALDVNSVCLVTEAEKYARSETGEEELTDLAADPDERRNLAADPAAAGRLAAARERCLDALLANKLRGPEQVSHA